MSTKILTLNHLAVRTLEDRARVALDKERRPDGKWDVLMDAQIADMLVDGADAVNQTTDDFIIQHLRRGL